MITRIRNANFVRASFIKVRNTNLTRNIAMVLKKEGFIDFINPENMDFSSDLIILLKYKMVQNRPYITNIVRVSSSGQRVYCGIKNLPRVLGGVGVTICLFQSIYCLMILDILFELFNNRLLKIYLIYMD